MRKETLATLNRLVDPGAVYPTRSAIERAVKYLTDPKLPMLFWFEIGAEGLTEEEFVQILLDDSRRDEVAEAVAKVKPFVEKLDDVPPPPDSFEIPDGVTQDILSEKGYG